MALLRGWATGIFKAQARTVTVQSRDSHPASAPHNLPCSAPHKLPCRGAIMQGATVQGVQGAAGPPCRAPHNMPWAPP